MAVQRDLPTGTVTFLFTDVEGSTKLLEEIGDEAYDATLAEHRQIVRGACAEQGGVEVDTQGDAFFFAFPTAPGALAAASAMTHALAAGPIQVRIGLHTGRPRVTDEGYVGKEVHFAARVAATGHGGQIVLSKATADLVEAELTELGEQRLKDVPAAVPIYQLGSDSFPPLKTISNTNLPRPASSFVGREGELADVLAKVEKGARLLTLTGPGGSGKTRLALEAAATLVPEYKAGVFWVGLAALRDSALVAETISQTLGAKDGLAEHIGEREMLLLLDNLEQVVEAAPELASLVEACPNLALLVTSRELLRVRGEVEYPVPPLASPEAVALFCERSGLNPDEEIAELCARLDNLPLAVELAAARTKALSPGQTLDRLSQRLDLLKGGRDADPRQQTLRATIEWSYELLSAEEQRLFRALSVFAGGCTLEAAEEVADADLDTLQSLVEKSLLRFSDGRYWMLETIREYAVDQRELRAELDSLKAHAEWVVRLAEQAELEWTTPAGTAWFKRLNDEVDNVRAAIEWGLAQDRGLALAVASDLWLFWPHTDRAIEGRRFLTASWDDGASAEVRLRALRALTAVANDANDVPAIVEASKARLELARATGDIEHEAAALNMLGAAAGLKGDRALGRQFYEESVELHRQMDDPASLAGAIGNLALLERQDGNLPRARLLLDESLALSRAHGSELDIVWALKELAMAAIAADSIAEAKELISEGLERAARCELLIMEVDLGGIRDGDRARAIAGRTRRVGLRGSDRTGSFAGARGCDSGLRRCDPREQDATSVGCRAPAWCGLGHVRHAAACLD